MPRRRRFDAPGLLHHVMNRGIARRTVFESRRDMRVFLYLLAREVRAGRIELLAFAILPTHFHLLLRSRTGELDLVMQRVLNQYVRYFNRSRRRDGPLFRGRYMAKAVRSRRYFENLIRYIDRNPVAARLASRPEDYPYGSAALYVHTRRPLWLATSRIDRAMGNPHPEERPAAYARSFGRSMSDGEARVIAIRLEHASADEDDWDDLVAAAPERVLHWMRRKARLADGTKPGLPYVDAALLELAVGQAQKDNGSLCCRPSGKRRVSAWPILRMGLLRDLGGLSYADLSRRVPCSPSSASRRIQQHAHLLEADESYAKVAADLACRCLGSG